MKGFFAHSSNVHASETIKEGIASINKTGICSIKSWLDLKIAGNYVIDVVCNEISTSDIFLVDLTYLNHNVLFELGYAIAKNKKVFAFIDTTISVAKRNYDRLNMSPIGYIEFVNSFELSNKFLDERPTENIENTLLKRFKDTHILEQTEQQGMLYIKSLVNTNASVSLTNMLNSSKIKPLIIDDPKETRNQEFEWYIRKCFNAFSVIGHFIDYERDDHEFHNAKVSLAIGLAHGFEKETLLIAQEPFRSPLDYRHLLKSHQTAYECKMLTRRWLDTAEQKYFLLQKSESAVSNYQKSLGVISRLDIGDYIAEQEIENIPDYFVDTAALGEAIKSNYTIFIGRKGTGKSALLYKLWYDFGKSKKNHVCIIKPLAYEISGLIQIIKSTIEDSVRSYFIESLWKYLLYTELTKSIYEKIKDRPAYVDLSNEEMDFIEFTERNKDKILLDFWSRFENIIKKCSELSENEKNAKMKVSEYLHDTLVSKMRDLLRQRIDDFDKVVILVDNLDKTWKFGNDIEELSQFLLGLLSVSNRINEELHPKSIKSSFSLIIFLRSDIFLYIYKSARERDKIKYHTLVWNDKELLLCVIEKRFAFTIGDKNSNNIWINYFPAEIDGVEIRDYIIKNILPRPRDIIFLLYNAIKNAKVRNHQRIEENDVIDAMKRYSQYAFDSLIVENGISIEEFERILYEFAGVNKILTYSEVITLLKNANIEIGNCDYIITLLCDRSFLGRRVGKDKFRYQYNYLEEDIIKALEKKVIDEDRQILYEINKPFRRYLEILD